MKAMIRIIPAAMLMTRATTKSNVHTKTINPTRKSTTATSSMAGIAATPAGTFHVTHASERSCRRRTFSRGEVVVWFHCRYSRIHCFARILKSADARLNKRLRNQRMLIHLALVETVNDEANPHEADEL